MIIMSRLKDDKNWVKEVLESIYGKVTANEGDRLLYLGMKILKRPLVLRSACVHTLKRH
jgi:hypothetical protein